MCAGSWSGRLLSQLGSTLTIALTQEQVQYFGTPHLDRFTPDRFPIWIWHAEQDYYGFPVYGEQAVKAARDMTGRFVTPETRSFEPDPDETELIRRFLQTRLPDAVGPTVLAKTCVYDLPRDRELVFGPLPGHPRVAVAIGAGHAGKFASLIGRVLAELTQTGTTRYPVEPFSAGRPSLAPDAPVRYRLGSDALGVDVAT
jgi:sarcosine oxidase